MPHIDSFFPSDYLSGQSLGNETWRLTIKRLQIEGIGSEERGEEKERKPVLYFNEIDQGLVLNRTNADTLSSAYGFDTDDWTGKSVDLYFDPSVMFGKKRVGGVRMTVPRQETRPLVHPGAGGVPIHSDPYRPTVTQSPTNIPAPRQFVPHSPSRALVDRVAGEDRDRDAPTPREEDYGRAGPR